MTKVIKCVRVGVDDSRRRCLARRGQNGLVFWQTDANLRTLALHVKDGSGGAAEENGEEKFAHAEHGSMGQSLR